jgi:tetratricopeptide (TPR) repeat protein
MVITVRFMHRYLANNDRSAWFHRLAVLLISLVVSAANPLHSQNSASQTFEGIEKQATEAREGRRLEDAAKLYREGLKLRPSWKEGNWYLGTSLYGLKRYAEARDSFRHLAILEPGNGPAWGLAGMCEFELKNYPRALEFLSRAESAGIKGNDELAYLVHFHVALLLTRSGESEQAIDRLIPMAVAGTFPEVIEALGLNILRAPLLPSEVPEQDLDLYLRAGEAMNAYVNHDTEGATRLFNELASAYPDHANVHYAYGAFLMQTDPDKALLEFHRTLELDPSHPNALLQIANLYLKQGAPDKALPYAQQAVKANPNVAVSHRVLGESLLGSGDTSAAIQELQTAALRAPEFPQTHFLLAEAYRRAANKLMANKEMTEFERLDRKQKSEFSEANSRK